MKWTTLELCALLCKQGEFGKAAEGSVGTERHLRTNEPYVRSTLFMFALLSSLTN